MIHSSLMKMCPGGAELFHTDRWTARQTWWSSWSTSCNFANAPKHYIFKLMVNFSINDSGNMKQVQKIEN